MGEEIHTPRLSHSLSARSLLPQQRIPCQCRSPPLSGVCAKQCCIARRDCSTDSPCCALGDDGRCVQRKRSLNDESSTSLAAAAAAAVELNCVDDDVSVCCNGNYADGMDGDWDQGVAQTLHCLRICRPCGTDRYVFPSSLGDGTPTEGYLSMNVC